MAELADETYDVVLLVERFAQRLGSEPRRIVPAGSRGRLRPLPGSIYEFEIEFASGAVVRPFLIRPAERQFFRRVSPLELLAEVAE